MKNVEIIDGKKGGENYTNAQFRTVTETTITSNLRIDETKTFALWLNSEFDHYSDKFPNILHYRLIKNNNSNLTNANGLLDISIPILPVMYNTNSPSDLHEFIVNGNEKTFKAGKANFTREEYEKRINKNSVEALNYILFSLAERYHIAEINNDKNTMELISNLSIIKENLFDLNCYSLIQENKHSYSFTTDPIYALAYSKFEDTKEKYAELIKAVNLYRQYDVRKELESRSTNHSIRPSKPEPAEFGE